MLILTLCGLIAGLGWWLLYSYGKPLVSIGEALKTDKKMPGLSTIIHALLQIITIALGSPLGREVAPRELGSLFATWVSEKAGLTIKETKIMIACGAGAGLAAVYNVPLGGAIFTVEVLFCTYSWALLIPALITSAIATLVSWTGLGIESIYQVADLKLSTSILVWSILTSPIFGFAAYWFIRIANQQRKNSFHDRKMIVAAFFNYMMIGILAIYLPVLLGNGKSAVQMEFSSFAGIGLSALLLGLRCLIIWTSLRVGSQGGLLTPSMANGALLAAVLGGLWTHFFPALPFSGFIAIGATSFLAAAQKMPITAIVLIFEFTHIHFDFLVPIMLSVSGAVITSHLCSFYFSEQGVKVKNANLSA
ncbi:chloride channel protein [Legionella sp. km772]|uniref:chloride channel protein n=1 Tax=Legionella sp. km772 TaxID=2498111 RepID=UPI001F1F0C0C|nr:chloride channel protein [Legionella sp. km772]